MIKWQQPEVVSVYRADLIGWPDQDAMRRSALSLLSAMGVTSGRRRIVIKPNVVWGSGIDSGITVHPAFVSGIIEHFRATGADSFVVAEGAGGESDCDTISHFQRAGYTPEWAAENDARLVDLNRDEPVRLKIDGRVFPSMPIARTILEPDPFFVNVPKLKTHNLAITTLSLKNLQGIVTPIQERHMCNASFPAYEREGVPPGYLETHERWANKVCDIYLAARPDLNVVDGVVGRDGTAFHQGSNHPCGLAIAGANAVAVDTVASYLMGFEPESLTYLRVAGERGLGPHRLDRIDLYAVRDGALEPCSDPSKLRASPPFRVLLGAGSKYQTYENVPYGNAELIPGK